MSGFYNRCCCCLCQALPHGWYAVIVAILASIAWLASWFQESCNYAVVTGPLVSQLVPTYTSQTIPFLQFGLSTFREPDFSLVDGEYNYTQSWRGNCTGYPTGQLVDSTWTTARTFAFLALVLGGGGTLLVWFSATCFVFSKVSWRWTGYELLLASLCQGLVYSWFATQLCTWNTCSWSYGSQSDMVAVTFWMLSGLMMITKYPIPKRELVATEEEEDETPYDTDDAAKNKSNDGIMRPRNRRRGSSSDLELVEPDVVIDTTFHATEQSDGDTMRQGQLVHALMLPLIPQVQQSNPNINKSMDDHVVNILTHGGINVSIWDAANIEGQSTQEERLSRHVSLLESWLGLPNADEWEDDDKFGEMMEDSAPFEANMYRAIETLLIHVWNPHEEPKTQLQISDDLQQESDPFQCSLYKSVLSIRVTKLLRYWLDLNMTGNDVMSGEDNSQNTLTPLLLKYASIVERKPSNQQQLFYPLIQALYEHIEYLPFLQSQVSLFTRSLMKGGPRDGNRVGQGLSNPEARLAHMQMTSTVTEKLNQEFEQHIVDLEFIVGEWYAYGSEGVRRQCRAQLGSVWSQFVVRSSGGGIGVTGAGMKAENTSSAGIDMTLRVLHRIILGTSDSLSKSHEHLLFHHLVPLHRPNSMVLWRDQTSLLDLYHEPLVQCIAVLLQKKPDWIGRVIGGLLEPDVWSKGGNTPKLVLLLHEIDTYLGCLPDSIEGNELGGTFPVLIRALGSCMASENSRLAQRALPFVKNKKFVSLLHANLEESLGILLPFLLRKEPSWNPTVRKMTYNVLTTLQNLDPERFVDKGNNILADGMKMSLLSPHEDPNQRPIAASDRPKKHPAVHGNLPETTLPKDYTLKSAMGDWKPETRPGLTKTQPPSDRQRQSNPPFSVTGVAPSAMNRPATRKGPPLGVTGVAPWAMKNTTNILHESNQRSGALTGVSEAPKGEATTSQPPSQGVLAYMEKIKPPEEAKGASSWSRAQMAETPTLLPTLKFHDLVFGHDLGSGSFGSVQYARLIDRSTTRSNWSEYAVKIVSTEKIQEMGYEGPVQREMAVLRMLSHPCISRLISSFRFHDGVYLVLEYASGGDLHGLLRKNGSLDHDSTRFVIGEVTSALASIHDLGLVYGDLKPENIVITETGHVKLTDFGGTRPVTEAAKQMIRESARNALKDLRDGDWKSKDTKRKEYDMDESGDEEQNRDEFQEYDPNEDVRIEGTTNYLPPEVVLGAFPSLAADSWALGCVMFQCLTGRPPVVDDDETRTKSRIVSFDASDSKSSESHSIFEDPHASHVGSSARNLILQLLSRQANERPTMTQVAENDFFGAAGIDIFSLYQHPAYPLDVGDVSPPTAEAHWARRQLSSIWAPQPQAYDISLDYEGRGNHVNASLPYGPIPEGPEGSAFFSRSTILPVVASASLPPTRRA